MDEYVVENKTNYKTNGNILKRSKQPSPETLSTDGPILNFSLMKDSNKGPHCCDDSWCLHKMHFCKVFFSASHILFHLLARRIWATIFWKFIVVYNDL